MDASIRRSYRYCQGIARRSGSSFYPAFWLLPRAKRRAMCALYAFLRIADDLGDAAGVPQRARQLAELRRRLRAEATVGDDHLLPAVLHACRQYGIPLADLETVLEGVEDDLAGGRFESFADLERYCYRVAGVVGRACVHIWGYRDAQALDIAVACGRAFQLTNILRDIDEDAARGRIYLPQEDLRRFQLSREELIAGVRDGRFHRLVQFEARRARACYEAASGLGNLLAHDGRRVFCAMFDTYRALLHRIETLALTGIGGRARLSPWEKLWIVARTLWRPRRESARTALAADARST